MTSLDSAAREMYFTAEEAATALGVSRATLYAYVSRRGIRSEPVQGSRERLYWKADVLQANRPKGRPPGSVAKSLPQSSISFISESRLYYRGYDAVLLSESSTFEEVAALLWQVPRDQVFTDRLPIFPVPVEKVGQTLADAGAIDRAIACFPLIEVANPRAYDFSLVGLASTGADVVRSLAALMMRSKPTNEPIHDYIATRLSLSKPWSDFVRRMLILSADHGLEPSSVAVRAVAGIGVSPYRSVAAGLLLVSGRRTLVGRIAGLARLLDELLEGDPDQSIMRRLKEGEQLPGFGYPAHLTGDPRTSALLAHLEIVAGDDDRLKRVKRAISVVYDALGIAPDYALIAHLVTRLLGQDERDSVFVLGRCAGWIAHSIEQHRSGETQSRASTYTGPLPQGA